MDKPCRRIRRPIKEDTMTDKYCARCGTATTATMRICPKCGNKFFGTTPPQPPVTGQKPPVPSASPQPMSPAQPNARTAGSATPTQQAPRQTVRPVRIPLIQGRLLPRWVIAACIIGVIAFTGILFASGNTLVDMAANSVSPAEERSMSEHAMLQDSDLLKLRSHELDSDHPASIALNNLGSRLVDALPHSSPYEYRFHIIKSDIKNAFAIPGGDIFVFTGLLNYAKSDAEIASVLAHEIQHVELQHGTRQRFRAMGTLALAGVVLGFSQDTTDVTTHIANKYSRDMENEADAQGARLLKRVDVSPMVMAELFSRWGKENGRGIAWLSDHPDMLDRAERISAIARE